MKIPDLIKVRQKWPRPVLHDCEAKVEEELAGFRNLVGRNRKIAVAVGSRGIADIDKIAGAVVRFLKSCGASPFIVAAMGSHGGGTVPGQLHMLEGYGITEASMGVPVRASVETVELPSDSFLGKVRINSLAYGADGIVVINRIKKHTDIHGEIESGLLKMIAIGLGNVRQAETLHANGLEYLKKSIPVAAREIIKTGKILFGLGIIENAYGDTASIGAVTAEEMETAEKAMLRQSKKWTARLPVREVDVLIIDKGGKDISGSCIETNVIGRMNLRGESELKSPRVKRIVVSDLSEKSQGNAAGIGLADFITRKFFNKIDFAPTYRNCISCYFPERALLPLVMENDREAVLNAMESARGLDPNAPRIVRIQDTLHLEELYVSPAVLEEIRGKKGVEITDEKPALFDTEGNLSEF